MRRWTDITAIVKLGDFVRASPMGAKADSKVDHAGHVIEIGDDYSAKIQPRGPNAKVYVVDLRRVYTHIPKDF
jgi:hypothetical protein